MRARYTIFPKAAYVLETFCGAVTFMRYADFVQQQYEDTRIVKHYHTISDYTQATLRLSMAEVEKIAGLISRSSLARVGKRALVINGSRNFAFADVFSSHIGQAKIDSRCFGYRNAALRWVAETHGADSGLTNQSFGLFR